MNQGYLEFVYSLLTLISLSDPVPKPTQPPSVHTGPVAVFSNYKRNCSYVVGSAGDDLHIVVNGSDHCASRIVIDGVRIYNGRKIKL